MEKLTPEELDQFTSAQSNYNDQAKEVAHIDLEIENLEGQKNAARQRLRIAISGLRDAENTIREKYGEDVRINMSDGTVVKLEKNEADS